MGDYQEAQKAFENMSKTVILTSALNRTQAIIDDYVVVDMRRCAFVYGLPHGALLISQRHDGELYASRLLGNRLHGIDGDDEAQSAWTRGVEAIMGHEAEQWLQQEAPQNYHAWWNAIFEASMNEADDYQLTMDAASGRGGYG